MKRLFTIFALFFSVGICYAQTTVSSTITSDQTWNSAGSPYLITKNVYVDTGVTITIMPGTVVKATASYLTLTVDGSIEAKGTSSSMIQLDSFEIKLSVKSKDYNPNTKKGCQFDYCTFRGRGSGSRILSCGYTDILVTNSTFLYGYYDIYSISSTSGNTITVDNCYFNHNVGFNYRQGYPIYSSGSKTVLNVTNCEFDYFYSIYAYGTLNFEKNKFNDFSKINFYSYAPSTIECNSFTKSDRGITLSEYAHYDTMSGIDFKYNTLDSINSFSFSRSASGSTVTKSNINNNNFLYFSSAPKVSLSGSNTNKLTSELINLKSNFWGSTDSATIESYIKDYDDDINIYARADFSNYLLTKNIGCGPNIPCKAGFKFTVDFDSVSFVDTSFSVNTHTSSWSFGDGKSGKGSTVGHLYNSSGKHTVCLYIYDSLANCRDTVCQVVETYDLPVTCEASFYVAEDPDMKDMIYIVDESKNVPNNTVYSWDFGDGTSSNMVKPTHTYSENKEFELCLNLTNSSESCNDDHCDFIGNIKNHTGPFSIMVISEDDLNDLHELNHFNISLYPNPSNGLFGLQTSKVGEFDIEVIDFLGKTVYNSLINTTVSGNQTLDLSHLESGLYKVILKGEKQVGISTILVQH